LPTRLPSPLPTQPPAAPWLPSRYRCQVHCQPLRQPGRWELAIAKSRWLPTPLPSVPAADLPTWQGQVASRRMASAAPVTFAKSGPRNSGQHGCQVMCPISTGAGYGDLAIAKSAALPTRLPSALPTQPAPWLPSRCRCQVGCQPLRQPAGRVGNCQVAVGGGRFKGLSPFGISYASPAQRVPRSWHNDDVPTEHTEYTERYGWNQKLRAESPNTGPRKLPRVQ
jgi:hypothetical protein